MSQTLASPVLDSTAPAVPHHIWLTLLVILTAPLLSVVDVFIVNMAIPAIRADLGATGADLELVIAGYLLGFSAFVITGGRAGDQFGRRRVFVAGLALFTITSCLCGLAPSIWQLVLYRFLQGMSAAFMVPQTIALIQVNFSEPAARNKAFGYYGITLGLASMVGLYLGGVLVETDWGVAGWASPDKRRKYDETFKAEALQSRSRRGNCYDNAHTESFWSRLKTELLDGGSFPGLAEAKLEIGHHIAYENAERRHLALGYFAPNHFETHFQTTSQLCAA